MTPVVVKCPKCKNVGGLEQVHKFANGTIHEVFCNTCGQISLLDITKESSVPFLSGNT